LGSNEGDEHLDERKVFLLFRSFWPSRKRAAMDRAVAEIEARGFSYRGARPVAFWRSIRYPGGAIELLFVRATAI